MKLYDNAFSPFARKVRMVLEHKQLPFEVVDALRPEMHAQLAAVNPRLEVPALEDDGLVVVNSSDIVAYLDHRHPARAVLPAEPRRRVEARAWERLADTLLDAITHDISIWKWPFVTRPDTLPDDLHRAADRELQQVYARLDATLVDREFVCGELSVADFALFPHLSAVRLLEVPFSKERHPHLFAWYRRLRDLPVFRADLDNVRSWLTRSLEEGMKIDRIVWRGDRIEWILAHGHHHWFVDEIESGRVGWPRSEEDAPVGPTR